MYHENGLLSHIDGIILVNGWQFFASVIEVKQNSAYTRSMSYEINAILVDDTMNEEKTLVKKNAIYFYQFPLPLNGTNTIFLSIDRAKCCWLQ